MRLAILSCALLFGCSQEPEEVGVNCKGKSHLETKPVNFPQFDEKVHAPLQGMETEVNRRYKFSEGSAVQIDEGALGGEVWDLCWYPGSCKVSIRSDRIEVAGEHKRAGLTPDSTITRKVSLVLDRRTGRLLHEIKMDSLLRGSGFSEIHTSELSCERANVVLPEKKI